MLMIIGLIFRTNDITQLVCGMSAHLLPKEHLYFVVVHSMCQVDVIAYEFANVIFTKAHQLTGQCQTTLEILHKRVKLVRVSFIHNHYTLFPKSAIEETYSMP